ncbi:MAG: hypothetical protein CSB44_10990 [Gammaproteobacteria bacterium]|nr:MAG: hypothetical protein CSB44_10990 [Gammaproteobacteria bacterium]
MRLLIPLFLSLFGAGIGFVVHTVVSRPGRTPLPCLVAGGVGAFAGLMARDLLDIEWGGNIGGSLAALSLGALVAALAVGLVERD